MRPRCSAVSTGKSPFMASVRCRASLLMDDQLRLFFFNVGLYFPPFVDFEKSKKEKKNKNLNGSQTSHNIMKSLHHILFMYEMYPLVQKNDYNCTLCDNLLLSKINFK